MNLIRVETLSNQHYEVLSYLVAGDHARLYRLPGGFWVTDPTVTDMEPGMWAINIQVIRRLMDAGLIESETKLRGPFKITAKGFDTFRRAKTFVHYASRWVLEPAV